MRSFFRGSTWAVLLISCMLSAGAMAGKVMISGQDSDDIGHVSTSLGGQFLDFIGQGNTNGGTGILILGGSTANTSRTTIDSWNAVANGGSGYALTQADTVAAIQSANLGQYAGILIPSSDVQTPGGVSQAQLDAINARSAAIAAYVNGGGNLFALTEAGLTNPFAWFPLGSLQLGIVNYSDVVQTPALAAAGFTATNGELNGDQWHNTFTGPAGFFGLQVLAQRSSDGAATLLGGGVGTVIVTAGVDVPTLSEWGLIGLVLVVMTAAGFAFRRQRKA